MTRQQSKAVEVKSIDELRDLLYAASEGCQFCNVQYTTIPGNIRNPKTSGMGDRILKSVSVNPLIGQSMEYINSVNNRLVKQDKETVTETQPRKWGERLQGTPFVHHKGNYYLEANMVGKPSTTWYLDGAEVPYETVKPFLREKKEGDLYGLGQENVPVWRDIRLDHITEVTVDHTRYVMVVE